MVLELSVHLTTAPRFSVAGQYHGVQHVEFPTSRTQSVPYFWKLLYLHGATLYFPLTSNHTLL